MPDVQTGKVTVAVAGGCRHRCRSVLVDGVAKFAEFFCVGRFRGDRVFPGHGRKIGKQVGPQADAIGPHQRAALVAAEMVFKTGLGIESCRADVEAGGVVPGMRILSAEADLPPDRRMQFDAVDPMVQLHGLAPDSRPTTVTVPLCTVRLCWSTCLTPGCGRATTRN